MNSDKLERIEQVRRALGPVKLIADNIREMSMLYGPEDQETIDKLVNGNTLEAAFWYGIDAQEELEKQILEEK